ncbi:MAG: FtsX-like permease family protein [Spirulinaceae cyanobacterium]
MVSIARKNLLEDKLRFLVAQAGIMFAVSLVTIQTGILNGFTRSTALLIDQSQADIWVTSQKMVQLELTEALLLRQMTQARKVEGVAKAEAVMMGGTRWDTAKGELTPLRVFGFDPAGELFVPGIISKKDVAALQKPYTVIVDETNLSALNIKGTGAKATIASLPTKIVGLTSDTQSLVSSASAFTSLENANIYLNSGLTSQLDCQLKLGDVQCQTIYNQSEEKSSSSLLDKPIKLNLNDPIAYILIKAKPEQNIAKLKVKLEESLLGTSAYTRQEMADKTRSYWLQRTGLGFVFGLGAVVGIIVGVVVVGQILYTSVSEHLKEFATMKAMGASNWGLYRVIIEQALWMAILGYLPGMLLCLGLAKWTITTQGILILITPLTAGGVFVITILMCVGSALFAVQKVTSIDPAIVFKS